MTGTRPRVALDARALQDRPIGGVGRGLASLVPRLVDRVDLVLLTDARRPEPSIDHDVPSRALRGPLTSRGVSWLQLAAPWFLRGFTGGVFHCPLYGLPYVQPVPMVVTIHDLTFEDHPDWFTPEQRFVFRRQGRHAARTARRIVTDSEAVRNRVIERYGVAEDRVVTVPFAVDPAFTAVRDQAADAVTRSSLHLPDDYVVALGGAPRRQEDVAVAAWQRATPSHDIALVVVGGQPGPGSPGLHRVGSVADHEWAAILAGASAFVYPTRYEGFGLPAVEAAACGAPVVCAPVGSLPEVLEDAAEWCDAPTVDAIAAGLVRVLGDRPRAEALRAAGQALASRRPGWDDAAGAMSSIYEAAHDG